MKISRYNVQKQEIYFANSSKPDPDKAKSIRIHPLDHPGFFDLFHRTVVIEVPCQGKSQPLKFNRSSLANYLGLSLFEKLFSSDSTLEAKWNERQQAVQVPPSRLKKSHGFLNVQMGQKTYNVIKGLEASTTKEDLPRLLGGLSRFAYSCPPDDPIPDHFQVVKIDTVSKSISILVEGDPSQEDWNQLLDALAKDQETHPLAWKDISEMRVSGCSFERAEHAIAIWQGLRPETI